MKTSLCVMLLASLLVSGCGKETPPASAPATNSPASAGSATPGENPLSAPTDYLNSLAKAQKSAVKTVDLAALRRAIEMFQVDQGRWPKDLNELVAGKFIPQIPAAPAGSKIAYDPATGAVKMVKE